MAADKKDPHATPLNDISSGIRLSILLMITKYIMNGAPDVIDSAIRDVRRRWDQLAPPDAQQDQRKAWPPSIVKGRSEWDQWFHKFMNGMCSVQQLDEMIQRANAAERPGAPVADPMPLVSDRLAQTIGWVSRIDGGVARRPLNDVAVEIVELEARLARMKADRDAKPAPPMPPPPPIDAD